ncbi:MAG: hypothetical protein K2X61_14780, partial [Caulobacteraceae bacterium]|nr:hypothetical protein [Caulobacteraceae bacterium]
LFAETGPDSARSGSARGGVGTGRDGTLSLNGMVQALFNAEGQGRTSLHEYGAREFYQNYCLWRETGDEQYLDEIDRLIRDCPHDAIVGNGYAPVLELLAGRLPASVRIVHLCRRSRERCVASLCENAHFFPEAYRYYRSDAPEHMRRIAAFHYGEMSPAAWDALPLAERFAWYYDKTHSLIKDAKGHFEASLDLFTEDLDTLESRQALATFVVGADAAPPRPVHLNSHTLLTTERVAAEHRARVQWLFGRLNIHDVLADDGHLVHYILDRYITWTGYQISGAIGQIDPSSARPPERILETLVGVREGIARCDATLRIWEANLRQAMGEAVPEPAPPPAEPAPPPPPAPAEPAAAPRQITLAGLIDHNNEGVRLNADGSQVSYNLAAFKDAFVVSQYDGSGWKQVLRIEKDQALVVNQTPVFDSGGLAQLRSFTLATLPDPNPPGRLIHVADGETGRRLAVSDGDSWRWPDGSRLAEGYPAP